MKACMLVDLKRPDDALAVYDQIGRGRRAL
jgi:hypothetical protein